MSVSEFDTEDSPLATIATPKHENTPNSQVKRPLAATGTSGSHQKTKSKGRPRQL
jgi:hypothetical protein